MGEEITVEVIRQLPLGVIAIIACVALWRRLIKAFDDHLSDLREGTKNEIAELRARIMVLEDVNHVDRSERYKYLPTLKVPTSSEMKDLD